MQRQHPKLSRFKFLPFVSISIAYSFQCVRKTIMLDKITITCHNDQREITLVQRGNEGRGSLHMISHSSKNGFKELLQVALCEQALFHVLQYLQFRPIMPEEEITFP